jgi:hypothetical protein
MKGLIAHETGNGGLANLLRDYNNVPVVELMRDVLDRILAPALTPAHHAQILFVQPDVNLG